MIKIKTVREILENDIAQYQYEAQRLKAESEVNFMLADCLRKAVFENFDQPIFSMIDEGCPNY